MCAVLIGKMSFTHIFLPFMVFKTKNNNIIMNTLWHNGRHYWFILCAVKMHKTCHFRIFFANCPVKHYTFDEVIITLVKCKAIVEHFYVLFRMHKILSFVDIFSIKRNLENILIIIKMYRLSPVFFYNLLVRHFWIFMCAVSNAKTPVICIYFLQIVIFIIRTIINSTFSRTVSNAQNPVIYTNCFAHKCS